VVLTRRNERNLGGVVVRTEHAKGLSSTACGLIDVDIGDDRCRRVATRGGRSWLGLREDIANPRLIFKNSGLFQGIYRRGWGRRGWDRLDDDASRWPVAVPGGGVPVVRVDRCPQNPPVIEDVARIESTRRCDRHHQTGFVDRGGKGLELAIIDVRRRGFPGVLV